MKGKVYEDNYKVMEGQTYKIIDSPDTEYWMSKHEKEGLKVGSEVIIGTSQIYKDSYIGILVYSEESKRRHGINICMIDWGEKILSVEL